MAVTTAASSKSQLVYDHIIERVVSGDYASGQQLHIGRLAEETRVSLIPVREALRRLESDGVVVVEHHRGARVADLDSGAYHDVMQTQAVLEALAVSLATPFITAEDLAEARELNQRMDVAHGADDPHSYHEASLGFHGLLQSRCPNTYLRESLDRGQLRVAAARAAVVGYSTEIARRLSEEHRHLLDEIERGASPREIETLMRAHREGTLARHDDELGMHAEGSGAELVGRSQSGS